MCQLFQATACRLNFGKTFDDFLLKKLLAKSVSILKNLCANANAKIRQERAF